MPHYCLTTPLLQTGDTALIKSMRLVKPGDLGLDNIALATKLVNAGADLNILNKVRLDECLFRCAAY